MILLENCMPSIVQRTNRCRSPYTVNGTATIPSGTYLWVLARRVDFDKFWWPQGEGKINSTTEEWNVSVNFGTQDDIGWDFDIAAIVVIEFNHAILKNYRINAMKTGNWHPIEMPETLSAPKLRKVRKVSH